MLNLIVALILVCEGISLQSREILRFFFFFTFLVFQWLSGLFDWEAYEVREDQLGNQQAI